MLRVLGIIVIVAFAAWLLAILWRRFHIAPTRRAMKQAARNPESMRDVARRIARKTEIKPPADPDSDYIRDLVERLLDEDDREMVFPRQQLQQIGAPAESFLLVALNDPRYKRQSPNRDSRRDSPYEQVVELLAAIGSNPLLPHLEPLLDSPDEDLRTLASLNIAHVAADASVPLVLKALKHADEQVRKYAIMGIGWALDSGHATPSFLHAMFDALVPIAAGEDPPGDYHAPEYMIRIDRSRATSMLGTDRFLHLEGGSLNDVLHMMQKHRIPVDRERLWAILEHAKPRFKEYPWEDIYGDCLLMLAESADARILEELEHALDANLKYGRIDAANALLRIQRLPSLDTLTEALWNREFASLSTPQRRLLALREVEGEVSNGGYSQYFFNSAGDHWPAALEAARSLDAKHIASQIERAAAVFGRKGPSLDNERRRSQYGRISDSTEKTLDDLSSEFYKDHDRLHALLARYVISNRAEFDGLASPASTSSSKSR